MVNSREKGKRGERDARDAVKLYWNCPDCIRAAQSNGTWSADLLYGPPNLHLEVKHYGAIAALKFLRQATKDAQESETPVVLMREDGEKRWAVMFWMEDTMPVLEGIGTSLGVLRDEN